MAYELTPIEDGYLVVHDNLSYRVGLRYWFVYKQFATVYNLLKCCDTLYRDVALYIAHIGFTFYWHDLVRVQCHRPCPYATLKEDEIVMRLETRGMRMDCHFNRCIRIPYYGKPLRVPYCFFEWEIEYAHSRRVEIIGERRRTRFFLPVYALSLCFLLFFLYRFYYGTSLPLCLALKQSSMHELDCSALSSRLLIAFLLLFAWFPFPFILVSLFLVVIHYWVSDEYFIDTKEKSD